MLADGVWDSLMSHDFREAFWYSSYRLSGRRKLPNVKSGPRSDRGEAGEQLGLDGLDVSGVGAVVDAHLASEHFQTFRSTVADWLAEPPQVRVLDALDVAPER